MACGFIDRGADPSECLLGLLIRVIKRGPSAIQEGIKTGIVASAPQTIWLSSYTHGPGLWFYGTREGGARWFAAHLTLPPHGLPDQNITALPPTFLSAKVGVLPVVFATSPWHLVLYYTQDAGATWTPGQSLSTGPSNQSLYSVPSTSCAFVSGGRSLYANGGRSSRWLKLSTPRMSHITAVDFVSCATGWVLANGNLYRTRDGGRSWVHVAY